MQALRSPTTPQQKRIVIEILRANPHLLQAFIRFRQEQAGNQQAAAGPQAPAPVVQPNQPQQPNEQRMNPVGLNGQYPPPEEILRQLQDVMGSPISPERQQQLIHVLRSNPNAMAAYVRVRGQRARVGAYGNQAFMPLHLNAEQQQQRDAREEVEFVQDFERIIRLENTRRL